MRTNSGIKVLYAGNKLSHHGYTPGVIETLGIKLEEAGYEVYYAGTRHNQLLRLTEILWKTLLSGKKVSYILIDTYSTRAFWYAYLTGLVARLKGTKYIPVLHGGDLPLRLKKSKRACDTLFLNSFANVAVSGYLSHEFKNAGYETILIPNNIDISKYQFKLREHPRPKLLWVRSFHRQYNPTMATDVLKELLKSYPDAELCMVGPDKDGSMEEFRKYVSVQGISDHVKITGLLKRSEWIKLSENYDFFINTTNVDNTPVSVIEAMALGLTVITTDAGGITYLVEDKKDAMIVKVGDSKKMADAIGYLISNTSKYRSLQIAARKKVRSLDTVEIIKLWTQLLS